MLQQTLLAFLLSSLTVCIHVYGTLRIFIPITVFLRRRSGKGVRNRPLPGLLYLVTGLLLLHLVAAGTWAAAFRFFGVFADFETAFYYSLTSYTTVGYGDVLPDDSFRLLGPIEAAVGVLMLGLSTAVFFAALQQVFAGQVKSVAE